MFRPGWSAGAWSFTLLILVLGSCAGFGHGGFHEEIAQLNQQLAEQPDSADLHFRRGQVYLLHGDWGAALADLDVTDRLSAGSIPTDLVRGEVFAGANRLDEARVALDRFIKAQPAYPRAFLARARVFAKLADNPRALADFRHALDLSSRPEPDMVVEVADFLAANSQLEEAVHVIDAGSAKIGFVPSLTLRAVDFEIQLQHWESALRRIDQMKETAPRPEPWMARRASLLAQAGRIGESRKAWEALLEHLDGLPPLERSTTALSRLREQAQQALSALAAVPPSNGSHQGSYSAPNP